MLALSVFHALRNAVASVAEERLSPKLDAPATNEAILMAIEELKQRDLESRCSRPEPFEKLRTGSVEGSR
jgi:xanthine dehydrogenase large subunit